MLQTKTLELHKPSFACLTAFFVGLCIDQRGSFILGFSFSRTVENPKCKPFWREGPPWDWALKAFRWVRCLHLIWQMMFHSLHVHMRNLCRTHSQQAEQRCRHRLGRPCRLPSPSPPRMRSWTLEWRASLWSLSRLPSTSLRNHTPRFTDDKQDVGFYVWTPRDRCLGRENNTAENWGQQKILKLQN